MPQNRVQTMKTAGSTSVNLVYRFAEGGASMADLLGGKGANLAEMVRLGLPVPPGFTISTEACRRYYRGDRQPPPGLWDEIHALLGETEQALGRRFALDAYRRFIQIFAKVVLRADPEPFEEALAEARERGGVSSDAELDEDALAWTVDRFLEIAASGAGQTFPSDPWEQLQSAVLAVFDSWNSRRAIAYRRHHGIPDELGTAVNVQAMVFGNRGWDSGTGVAFSRSPATGERRLYGEYLANAQGEDIVSGARTPHPIEELAREMPSIHRELATAAELLERH